MRFCAADASDLTWFSISVFSLSELAESSGNLVLKILRAGQQSLIKLGCDVHGHTERLKILGRFAGQTDIDCERHDAAPFVKGVEIDEYQLSIRLDR